MLLVLLPWSRSVQLLCLRRCLRLRAVLYAWAIVLNDVTFGCRLVFCFSQFFRCSGLGSSRIQQCLPFWELCGIFAGALCSVDKGSVSDERLRDHFGTVFKEQGLILFPRSRCVFVVSVDWSLFCPSTLLLGSCS